MWDLRGTGLTIPRDEEPALEVAAPPISTHEWLGDGKFGTPKVRAYEQRNGICAVEAPWGLRAKLYTD